MRVLFLSADVGVGHTSAASALQASLSEVDPDFEGSIVDSYRYAASVVSRVVSNGYLGMVKTLPQMYRFLYQRAEQATEVGPFRTWLHQFTASNLRGLLRDERPDAVVCTHAFPCGAMAEYKREFADAPPIIGVVTDFAVHAFWVHTNIDAYAVATEEMRRAMIARGVRPDRIAVTGIPVRSGFRARPERQLLRNKLDLPPERRVVLLMGGGLGIGPLGTMMHVLDDLPMPIMAVVIVGRSGRSEARALEAARHVSYPVRVLRFVENVDEYMHASDVLITKPGGLTSAEALVAGIPMVLFKPLPGQEERNTRYLVERRAALRAKQPSDLLRTVQGVLESETKRMQMRVAIEALAKPQAADDIAEIIRSVAGPRREEAIA